eukprot:UN07556
MRCPCGTRDRCKTVDKEGWNTHITINADCAGIGSGIEGITKVCQAHSVTSISEFDDLTRQLCISFALPKDVRSNVLDRNPECDFHTDVYITGFPVSGSPQQDRKKGSMVRKVAGQYLT